MSQKTAYLIIILAVMAFSASCSSRQYTTLNQPEPEKKPEEKAEETQNIPAVTETAVEQDKPDSVDDYLKKTINEVSLLQAEGEKLLLEDNLEESRESFDEALDVILSSGLALDAHPELSKLFKQITKKVVKVEDLIAQSEDNVDEAELTEEMDDMEDGEIGENKDAPAVVTYDLPVVVNNRVEQYIKLFSEGKNRKAFEAGLKRSGMFVDRFKEILAEEGVPTDLVALAMIESTYKVKAYSRAKAKGIWQFMSWEAKHYGLKIDYWIDERSAPYKACRASAKYLRELHDRLGDWLLAMAAYNTGPGRVSRAVKGLGTTDFWTIAASKKYLLKETRNFVPSILAACIIMKSPEKYGFGHVEKDKPWEFKEVPIASAIDLRVVADMAGVTIADIQALNPQLRRMITPQNYPDFKLKLPLHASEDTAEKIAALPVKNRLKYTEHLVTRGQTLSGIAKKYRSSVNSIMTANNIRNPRTLKPGMHLIIPLSPGYSPEYTAEDYSQPSAKRGEKVLHTVRKGESLYRISRQYRTSVGSIAQWNNLNPSNTIYPGKKLTIYAYTSVKNQAVAANNEAVGSKLVYNVKQGDSLYEIASRYKTTVRNLKRWNNLRSNRIHPGDRLTLYLGDSNND